MCLAQEPQRSDAGEARTRGPSFSSQALYHGATALPQILMKCHILCSISSGSSLFARVKVQNFKKPELSNFKTLNLLYAYKVLTISSLNGQLPKDEQKINQRSY